MTVKIDTDAEINSVRLAEQAGNPATPAAGYWQLYAKLTGLFIEDDAGNVIGPFITGTASIGARVYNDANISTTTGDNIVLTFNQERYDTDNIHSTTGSTSRLTCNTEGKYLISATLYFANNITGARGIQFLLNGTTTIAIHRVPAVIGTDITGLSLSTIYNLSVGNYVEVVAYQTSNGNLDVVAGANFSPEFMMQRIG